MLTRGRHDWNKITSMVAAQDEEHQRLSVVASGSTRADARGVPTRGVRNSLPLARGPRQRHAHVSSPGAQRRPPAPWRCSPDRRSTLRRRGWWPVLAEAAMDTACVSATHPVIGRLPRSRQWKQAIQSHAVQPCSEFRSVSGKNSTVMALAIDAVDRAHQPTSEASAIGPGQRLRLVSRAAVREQGLSRLGQVVRRDHSPRHS